MRLALLLLGSWLALPTPSEDWPGWRGPRGDGTSRDRPPLTWSETENVRWKVALPGAGLSSPIVTGEHVIVTAAVPTGTKRAGVQSEHFREPFELEEQELVVLAFDRASGKELWSRRVATAMPHEPTHPENSYATPTPATDGTRVFASFGSLGLFALTLSGEPAWQVDLGDLLNKGHGDGSSPLVHDGGLFVLWAHNGTSFLVRLDPATGAERWRVPMPEGNNCSTPLAVRIGNEDQLIVAGRHTVALDPGSGRELWSFGPREPDGITSMATPVAMDELVLVPSVNRRDLRALIAGHGETPAEVLWSRRASDNIPSPLAHDGRIVLLDGGSALLTVLDGASGEPVYGPERLEGVHETWASPVLVGSRLYVVDREGTTEVLELGDEPRRLASNRLDDAFKASPAVAGDALWLRGERWLYCLAEKRSD